MIRPDFGPGSSEPSVAAVTGAAGNIGSFLCDFFRRHGYRVVEFRRDVAGLAGDCLSPRPYELRRPVDPDSLRGVDLLVHCAHDFGGGTLAEMMQVNLQGSVNLFEAARAAEVGRVAFISTMSSFEGCRSNYGRVKLATEREATQRGVAVIRPGLVYGGGTGGMVRSLTRLVCTGTVLPLVGTGQQKLYLCHIEDLCWLVLEVGRADPEAMAAPLVAASERALTFREILQELARAHGRRVVLLPLPWRLIWLGLTLLEKAKMNPGFRSDSLIGLVNTDPRPDFSTTRRLGVSFRDFDAASTGPS
jgi:nucleoside-diphosphate-sugar epimerase